MLGKEFMFRTTLETMGDITSSLEVNLGYTFMLGLIESHLRPSPRSQAGTG